MPYQYQPLPYLQSLRLVQIVPRPEGTAKASPIHLNLRTVDISLDALIDKSDHGRPQMWSSVSFDEYVTMAPGRERFKILDPERPSDEFDLVTDEDSIKAEEPIDDDDIIAGPGMTGMSANMLPELLRGLRLGQEIHIRGNNMSGLLAPDGAKVRAAGRQARPVIARPAGEAPYRDRFDWGEAKGPFPGNYVALSYCWGSESDKPEIFVEGQSLRITKNLHSALRRFRELDIFKRGLWMWIDAISINQDDGVEKPRQLKMMDAIYRQAGNVVVWLGDTDGPEQETLVRQSMALLQDISRHYRTEYEAALDDAGAWESCAHRRRATLQLQAARKIWSQRSGIGTTFLNDCQERELVAIHDFFTRDYWRRLWIIQELASSQSSAPIFFGECVTQWRFVRDASYLLLDIEDQFREMTSSALERRGAPMRSDYSVRHVTVIGDIARLGRLQPEHFDSNVPLPIEHNVGTNPGNQVLRSVLALACGAGCKEPGDRIYGLLNLPAMPWVSMDITLGQSAKQAFVGFAMACVEQDLSLSILSLLDGADGGKYDLPSWCPNFARGADAAIRPLEGTWSANNNELGDGYRSLMWGNVSFEDEEPMTLSCMAWIVDTVDGLGAVSAFDQANHTFDKGFVSEVVQPSMRIVASTDDSTENIIYETLVAGARIGGEQAHETFKHLLSAFTEKRPPSGSPDIPNWEFIQSSKSLKINGEPLSSFFTFFTEPINATNRLASAEARQTMEACTRNRRLIVTETGRLGLAPVRVQKGDRVIIMHSHTVPLIVRPIHEVSDGHVKRMLRGRIIGEAYVSGIMYGEVVEQYREISQYMAPAQLQHCYFV